MEPFEELLLKTLQARPGLTKERLAAAMSVACDDDFRERLSDALDHDIGAQGAGQVLSGADVEVLRVTDAARKTFGA